MNDNPTSATVLPGRYRHYKGQEYEVLAEAEHTETGEEFVVYTSLYGDHSVWIRPKAMFRESVVVDGHEQPRFRLIDSGATRHR